MNSCPSCGLLKDGVHTCSPQVRPVHIRYWHQETTETGSWKLTKELTFYVAESFLQHFAQGVIVDKNGSVVIY